MAGEFDFIRSLRGQSMSRLNSDIVVPLGDDFAAVRWDKADLLLVGVDQVLEGRHFDLKTHTPYDVGRKAMNRNLSDCAAMAAMPAYAVATLALPRAFSIEHAKAIYQGMTDAAARFDCAIIGGDTGSWDGPLVVTVTLIGRSAGITPITRSGAKPGDRLYVTGPLGGSILGRHISFEPRITLARELASRFNITAMMDISDGISSDLRHICDASNVGSIVDTALLPVHADVDRLPAAGMSHVEHAMHDGEDHELLFTSADEIPAELAMRVGEMTSEAGIRVRVGGTLVPLSPRGWEHRIEP